MSCYRGPCFACGNPGAMICDGICGTCGTNHGEEEDAESEEGND
jgi:hypothetical protein